eukprot:TRINITY_DN112979_c0_g1_i1.p1 TRINITY_DN112979_c0_g1~~TRINITY_DN112979_c0_g1_i1.p1  ORF type:complete len:206 (-),score=61.22 TRINITY_DN112979_c0_g1_i1:44-661(-)
MQRTMMKNTSEISSMSLGSRFHGCPVLQAAAERSIMYAASTEASLPHMACSSMNSLPSIASDRFYTLESLSDFDEDEERIWEEEEQQEEEDEVEDNGDDDEDLPSSVSSATFFEPSFVEIPATLIIENDEELVESVKSKAKMNRLLRNIGDLMTEFQVSVDMLTGTPHSSYDIQAQAAECHTKSFFSRLQKLQSVLSDIYAPSVL